MMFVFSLWWYFASATWYDETETMAPLAWEQALCRGVDCGSGCLRSKSMEAAVQKASSALAAPSSCGSYADERFESDSKVPQTTTASCYESRGNSASSSSRDCALCPRCSTLDSVRTCVYENIYFDGATSQFLFFSSKKKSCPGAVLPGLSQWPLERVASLPTRKKNIFFKDPVLVSPQLHGAFAHGILESLFAAYWLMAEMEGQWLLRENWTLFYDGFQAHLHFSNFQRNYDRCSGKAKSGWLKTWPHHIVDDRRLFRGIPRLSDSLTRFRKVVVSGQGGRSPWNGATFNDKRSFLKADLEFSRAEKTNAFLRYLDALEGTILPRRHFGPTKLDRLLLAGNATTIEEESLMTIVILNREAKYARSLSEARSIAQALRKAFPGSRVVLTTPSSLSGDYPSHLLQLMRNASLVVSPHGAQLAHAAFASPGAAILEVQPSHCHFSENNNKKTKQGGGENPMYRYISRFAGLRHATLRAKNGGVCSCKLRCPTLHVDRDHLVDVASSLLKDQRQQRHHLNADLRHLLQKHQRPRPRDAYAQCTD